MIPGNAFQRNLVRVLIGVFLAIPGSGRGFSQATDTAITAEDLKTYVRYLASDELEGRRTGAPGNEKAAEYIADLLERYGVTAGGDGSSYFQKFDFISTVQLGRSNSLTLHGIAEPGDEREAQLEAEFRPVAFSSTAHVEGPLVFVGYGISAPDVKYDDYAGLNVEGKIVVALRYAPDGDNPHSDYSRYSSLRNKARIAREKGAAALIFLTGPSKDSNDVLIRFAFDKNGGSSGLPVISMKRSLLAPSFASLGVDLKVIQDSIAATRKPRSFELAGVSAIVETDVEQVTGRTANVVGYLEGVDPQLKNQAVILGAHFDHLGYGGEGSGSLTPDTVAVHHGADDNASGTAALLELAQKLANERDSLKRTVVFTFFTGEELGTLGSLYYVNHPLVPLSQTVAMLNMDMVGRLTDRKLTIDGTGTSSTWIPLLQRYNTDSTFLLSMNPDGFGPSDHASFYGKEIPVLFFWTGTHDDYHKPSDTWDRLNYAGEQSIVRYVYSIANDVVNRPERPPYVKVESQQGSGGDRRAFAVSLWIVPDYSGGKEGMKINSVRPKGPAEKAGLKAGDIIVGLAGKKVLNIYDYMGILGELKAGDVVDVDVLRDGRKMTVKATMEKTR